MKARYLIMWMMLCLTAFQPTLIRAHGLHMTTVSVTQRQGDHLSFVIHTSLIDLFNRMEYDGKPDSVIYLAQGSEDEIVAFRRQVLNLLQNMSLTVAQHPLQSVVVRIVEARELREMLLHDVAEQLLRSGMSANAHGDSRSNYLRIDIDAFIPKGVATPVLEANFPKELGQILVSYNKPQMQTVEPDEQGSHYLQPLQ